MIKVLLLLPQHRNLMKLLYPRSAMRRPGREQPG